MSGKIGTCTGCGASPARLIYTIHGKDRYDCPECWTRHARAFNARYASADAPSSFTLSVTPPWIDRKGRWILNNKGQTWTPGRLA